MQLMVYHHFPFSNGHQMSLPKFRTNPNDMMTMPWFAQYHFPVIKQYNRSIYLFIFLIVSILSIYIYIILSILSILPYFHHISQLSYLPQLYYPSWILINILLSSLSIYLSIYLFVRLSIYLSIFSICLYIYVYTHLSFYLSDCLFVHLSVYLSIYPSILLSIFPFLQKTALFDCQILMQDPSQIFMFDSWIASNITMFNPLIWWLNFREFFGSSHVMTPWSSLPPQ